MMRGLWTRREDRDTRHERRSGIPGGAPSARRNHGLMAEPTGRVVVTGAAGFIGSRLVELLLDAGRHVVGIDAFTTYYPPAIKRANIAAAGRHPAFELLPAALGDLDLDEVLHPGDTVFHLAAQPGVRASWGSGFADYVRDNVTATQHLLEAARRRDVARVVHASSSSVYGDAPLPMAEDGPLRPISPYGVTKLTAEQLGHVYWAGFGLPVVPLRFFTVYGPRQRPDMAFHRFIRAIALGEPLTLHGDGTQRRDFTHVDDVARALVAAAERAEPGVPVNVAGGSSVSVLEAIALLEQALERRAVIEHRVAPPGDARDTAAVTTRLDRLGVTGRVPLGDGLRSQVEWQVALMARTRRPAGSAVTTVRAGAAGRARTVMLYSHDTYGLGHLRRNLALAHAMVRRDAAVRVVILSGSRVSHGWELPPRISVAPLPPVVKTGPGEYRPVERRSTSAVVAERAGIIASSLLRHHPDVLLVDHAPLGMKGELSLSLEMARDQLSDTRVLLGLRDILDDPAVVRADWAAQGVHETLAALYDGILVYGCRHLYDVTSEYGMTDAVSARTRFAGYVAKDPSVEPRVGGRGAWTAARRADDRRVLVLGGGGGDAAVLFSRFLDGWAAVERATGAHALLVTGPLMDPAELAEIGDRAASLHHLSVVHFARNVLSLVDAADLIVSMGGYNSVVEVVAAGKPLLVCPRVAPRREQLMRAEMLAGLGLAHVHRLDGPEELPMSEAVLRAWAAGPPGPEATLRIDLGGAERVAETVLDGGAVTALAG